MRRIKSHTIQKLEYLRKYIEAYLVATKRLPIKYYIDAFAGSGQCILCNEKCESKGGLRCQKCGKGKLVDGSVMISLKTKNTFSSYIFIDLDKNYIDNLKTIINGLDPLLQKKVLLKQADSNIILKEIYKYILKYAGCLIFLDPEGPELEWETIKYLSKIPKADLFILYPYDMSLVRLASKYPEKLDKFYGDKRWIDIYKDAKNFDPEKRRKALLDFYIQNLKKLKFTYIEWKTIKRRLRDGKSLYHLILTSHHPAATKIMNHIYNKELDGQQKLI